MMPVVAASRHLRRTGHALVGKTMAKVGHALTVGELSRTRAPRRSFGRRRHLHKLSADLVDLVRDIGVWIPAAVVAREVAQQFDLDVACVLIGCRAPGDKELIALVDLPEVASASVADWTPRGVCAQLSDSPLQD